MNKDIPQHDVLLSYSEVELFHCVRPMFKNHIIWFDPKVYPILHKSNSEAVHASKLVTDLMYTSQRACHCQLVKKAFRKHNFFSCSAIIIGIIRLA